MRAYKQLVISSLESLAPLSLADTSWDNVGLLIDPYINELKQEKEDKPVLLTIDLTKSVVEEAISKQVGMIVSYHPPIFNSIRILSYNNNIKLLPSLMCLSYGISVYTPHTALDNTINGINDWLANNFNHIIGYSCKPISSIKDYDIKLGYGIGRTITWDNTAGISLNQAIQIIKTSLQLNTVRIAIGQGKSLDSLISSIAICAGSGGSVLKSVSADLYWTGEMSHHDILNATAQGISVCLCEHTNTERGYLKQVLAPYLQKQGINVICSHEDHDPIQYI